MESVTLNGTTIAAPRVVLGCMRIESLDDAEIRSLVAGAIDLGIDFFDHAACYGATMHGCERRFAEALGRAATWRDRVTLQTKCGIHDGIYDFSSQHILASVDDSLAALGTDYIDILLLHRPDPLVEPEEVAAAFDRLEAEGKVRHFGVSNHTPGQIEVLRTAVRQPLIVNQLQLSITHAPIIASGMAMNMAGADQAIDRDGGILDYCRVHSLTVQAWSPFQKGFFDGVFLGDPEFAPLGAVIDRLAAEKDASPEAIATAWILRHPARCQVVLGTTNLARVGAAARGADIELTRAEWFELFTAAGHIVP